ncbi:MAG: RDD family protein [Gemmatimonadota bacterium]|jgi:hypothetical protein
MANAQVDPRTIITPESFAIAPDLIGLPLAKPSRRLFAMLLDLIPVAIITNAGFGVFLGALAVVLVWRVTSPLAKRRGTGFLIRSIAAIVAFTWVTNLVGGFGDWTHRVVASVEAVGDNPDDAAAVAQALQNLPEQFRSPELDSLIARATEAAGIDTDTDTPTNPDSIIVAYADAVQRGDSTAVARLQDPAELAIAGPRIERLQSEREDFRNGIRQLRDENERLQRRVQQEEKPRSIRTFIAGLADDLGIGFGWGALYFTAFLVLGRGQTPGKRAMGVKVIRLDGKPIGWWYAFERFGSYFASFTTGLVGFAQILWDRNRQALHDKVVETVVIRVRKAPPLHVKP